MLKKIIIFLFLKHLNFASTGLITQVHYIDSKVKYFRKQKKTQNNNNKEKKKRKNKTKQEERSGEGKPILEAAAHINYSRVSLYDTFNQILDLAWPHMNACLLFSNKPFILDHSRVINNLQNTIVS